MESAKHCLHCLAQRNFIVIYTPQSQIHFRLCDNKLFWISMLYKVTKQDLRSTLYVCTNVLSNLQAKLILCCCFWCRYLHDLFLVSPLLLFFPLTIIIDWRKDLPIQIGFLVLPPPIHVDSDHVSHKTMMCPIQQVFWAKICISLRDWLSFPIFSPSKRYNFLLKILFVRLSVYKKKRGHSHFILRQSL